MSETLRVRTSIKVFGQDKDLGISFPDSLLPHKAAAAVKRFAQDEKFQTAVSDLGDDCYLSIIAEGQTVLEVHVPDVC